MFFFSAYNYIHFMAALWAVFTFGGSGPALTAHGSSDINVHFPSQHPLFVIDQAGEKSLSMNTFYFLCLNAFFF
jgi:hypothetical protein